MLCKAFATFSYCLFIGLSAVIFCLQKSKKHLNSHLIKWNFLCKIWVIVSLKHQWPCSFDSHTNPPCISKYNTCLHHALLFSSFWHKLIMLLSVQKLLFQSWAQFLAKANLSVLLFSVTIVFHLESIDLTFIKVSLDCRIWQWYLYLLVSYLDFWLDFFNPRKNILWSPTSAAFWSLPGLLVLMSSPEHSFFFRTL